jgi:CheY-like chemotaxis protein
MFTSIYIIDDDPIDRFITRTVIRSFCPDSKIEEFSEASTAMTALRLLAENDAYKWPELILLDINMPVMNGFTFLDQLKDFSFLFLENCSIFMITSSSNAKDVEQAMNTTLVKTYIIKPLTHSLFTNILEVESSRRPSSKVDHVKTQTFACKIN